MIRLTDIRKRFGELEVLKGVSLGVRQGEVVSVVGASGAGKTTLAGVIANEMGVNIRVTSGPAIEKHVCTVDCKNI